MLRGADLTRADLTRARLRGAYLDGAYLDGAYMEDTDFRKDGFQGASVQRLLARLLLLLSSLVHTWKQRVLLATGAGRAAWGCLPVLVVLLLCTVAGQAASVRSIEPVTPTPTVVVALAPAPTSTPEIVPPPTPIYTLVPATDRTTNARGVSQAIQPDVQRAMDDILELTGVDLAVQFGDTSRPLELAPQKVGTDWIDWHKTGRAIDLPQSRFNHGVIAKEPSGADMFFRLYLPAKVTSSTGTQPQEGTQRYLTQWTTVDRASFVLPPQPFRWYVDVTAILEDYGFERIKAIPGWEHRPIKMEWWHYEKRDGLTMYHALREIYTEDQIIDGHRAIYRSDKEKFRKRLLDEGFPEAVIDRME